MKTTLRISILYLYFLLGNVPYNMAQTVCMVTADFEEAENYIIIWEKPTDISEIDSVFIYRKVEGEDDFIKIGSRSMQDDFSFFIDPNSSTITNSWYRISYLYNNNEESPMSPWHRPVVLDYQAGLLIWSEYEKEGQIDETWISGYECLRDVTGLGLYTTMGYWETAAGSTQTQWFDSEAASNENFRYQMKIDLPSCEISRSNINTSRSNIKGQYSNNEAGLNESYHLNFTLSPNPSTEKISIVIDEKMKGSDFIISSANGQMIRKGTLTGIENTIQIQDLDSGIYFFHIRHNNTNYARQFIKQ